MDDVMLPYRTEWRTMLALLDYAKGKGVDRTTLEGRLGAGEALRETLNAVEQLGLARRDDAGEVHLTEQGERLAYAANDAERRHELATAMLRYEPYAVPLERALAEGLSVLDGPWVERVWQVDMRLGQPRNRVEEARTFFLRLADDAGCGTFRRGVRGQPTRLDLAPDAVRRITALRDEARSEEPEPAPAELLGGLLAGLPAGRSGVSLSVTVDMSEWDLAKIEAFLRLIGTVPGRSAG